MRQAARYKKLILIMGVVLLYYFRQFTEVKIQPAYPENPLVCAISLKPQILDFMMEVL